MKVLAVALLIIGAVINYLSKIIYKLFSKKEAQDEENVRVKLIGVVIFLVGLILCCSSISSYMFLASSAVMGIGGKNGEQRS